jgi:hypothetical protein
MRRLAVLFLFLISALQGTFGADFKLSNGDVLRGEAASFNDDGLVVRLDIGGFSPRTPWGKFTQETLKMLEENPQAKPFVEPYIEIPIEVKEQVKEKKKEIVVKEPPQVPLADTKTSFFGALANPVGYLLLGALFLANLYAALEIARWRGRPAALVVGVSAIVPFFGPLLFALLPGSHPVAETHVEAPPPEATAPVNPMAHAGAGQSNLGLASAGHGAPAAAGNNPVYSQVYNRSNTTFDRRFFETKFTGFFRVVPTEPEKSLVIVVKAAKAEYKAIRITRISANEVHLQVQAGSEVSVPFAEMVEVAVKPRGAK